VSRPHHGGNLTWAAQIAGCPVSHLVDFSASINPLGPPQSALAVIKESLGLLSSYPDPNYSQLRAQLGKWHNLPSEWILPGNGAAELLTWASWDLSQQELIYLVTPSFGDYQRALTTFRAKIQPCPLDLNRELWQQSLQINPPNPKAVGLLLNNPHNPTGKLWTRGEILPYLKQFALVVVDEAFMDFLPPHQQQSLIPLLEDYPNLVVLRSLTKFYSLPGLRIGYVLAHPERLQRWQTRRDPWPVNILADQVAQAVIQDYQFQQQTWHWLSSHRYQLYQELKNINGLSPLFGSANFLLVKTQLPSSQLQIKLLQKYHLLIRDCLSFPELGDRFFRMAIRTERENKILLEALRLTMNQT
jgi:L-threonine-O-3-phosphate decarboxylase